MSKSWLESILNDVATAHRINRQNAANIVWDNPNLFKDLFEETFKVDKKESIKAAWVLEWICTHKSLDLIIPHLDAFTANIHKLTFDSSKRPCAKICEHLAIAYDKKATNLVKENLTPKHIELIVETGFDWLIGQEKIAVKAYTMQTLFIFGKYIDWVHPELENIIRNSVIHESKGCESRGRKILALIEKHRN